MVFFSEIPEIKPVPSASGDFCSLSLQKISLKISQKSSLLSAFFLWIHVRTVHLTVSSRLQTSGAPSSTLFSARSWNNEFLPHSSLNHWNWTQMQDPNTELVLQLFEKFLRFHDTILFWPGDTGGASTCEEVQLGVGSEFNWSMKIQVQRFESALNHYVYAMMCHALYLYRHMYSMCKWCMYASSMSNHWIWSHGHVSVHARPCSLTHTYQCTLSWYTVSDMMCLVSLYQFPHVVHEHN